MTTPLKASLVRRRVLLAEDEYLVMRDLRSGLQAMGATVVGPAPSVEGALALIAETSGIDAAVLDIDLRGETIYPVADMLSARGIPFVFATGYAIGTIDARYRAVPACEKPVDMRDVGRLLAGLLAA